MKPFTMRVYYIKDYDEVQAKQYAQQNVDVWLPKLDRYSDWESAPV